MAARRVVQPAPLVVARHRQAGGHGRRLRRGRRLRGVPVRRRSHLVGQVVAVAVLDRHLDLPPEAHRVLQVQHVAGLVAAGVVLVDRRAVAQEGVVLHAPGVVQVILAAGAVQVGRPAVAVHPDHVVALAPPGALEVGHRQVAAQIVPAPARLQDHVVVVPRFALPVDDVGLRGVDADLRPPTAERVGAAKLGVQVARLRARRRQPLVVEVEVLHVFFGALVDQFHQRPPPIRHRQVAVQRAPLVEAVVGPGGGAEQRRLVAVDDAVAQAEEVAERDQHAGRGGVVPGDAQQALAEVVALGEPEMGDDAGAFQVGEHPRFAGRQQPAVPVAPAGVPGGDPPGAAVGDGGKVIVHAALLYGARRALRNQPM